MTYLDVSVVMGNTNSVIYKNKSKIYIFNCSYNSKCAIFKAEIAQLALVI